MATGATDFSSERKKRIKDKKRKREEENSDATATATATATMERQPEETMEATVQVLFGASDRSMPLVGYFPSGFNPQGEHGPARVNVYRNRSRSNRMQLVVSPSGSNVNFVGSSYAGEAAAPQTCTYALGVLDKATQTLKVLPIACNKIFRLQPRVAGSADDEPSDIEKEELTVEKKKEKLRELTITYGTKKSIMQAKKLHDLNQEDDPDSQKDLDAKFKDVEINKNALEGTSAQAARNIPPYDLSATTPEGAYPLDKIIFKGEWDFLEDLYELLQAGAEVTGDSYPTFVCKRVHKPQEIEDEGDKRKLLGVLSYITHLVKFKDKNSMEGYSSAKSHKIPSLLYQKFTSMFSDPESKRLSPSKIDLLLSYILVLTLIADGFRSDPTDISKDLRMNPATLRVHYENLGCKLLREDKVLLATLPVPLQFPNSMRRRRR